MDQVWGETLSISGIRWIQRNLSSEGGQKPMNRWNVPFNMASLILINDHHYHHPHNHFWLMGFNCPGEWREGTGPSYPIPHYISRYLQNVKQSEAPSKITHRQSSTCPEGSHPIEWRLPPVLMMDSYPPFAYTYSPPSASYNIKHIFYV